MTKIFSNSLFVSLQDFLQRHYADLQNNPVLRVSVGAALGFNLIVVFFNLPLKWEPNPFADIVLSVLLTFLAIVFWMITCYEAPTNKEGRLPGFIPATWATICTLLSVAFMATRHFG